MRNQYFQNMVGGTLIHSMKNEYEILKLYRKGENENAQTRYLKCWGNDYPYLKGDNQPSYLPIPEDSDAQRFLRKVTKTF